MNAVRDSFIDDLESRLKPTARHVFSTYDQRSPIILVSNASSQGLIQRSVRLRVILQGKDTSVERRHGDGLTQSLPFITCGMRLFCSLL